MIVSPFWQLLMTKDGLHLICIQIWSSKHSHLEAKQLLPFYLLPRHSEKWHLTPKQ